MKLGKTNFKQVFSRIVVRGLTQPRSSPGQRRAAGLGLVPTDLRPHFTVRRENAKDDELAALLAILGPTSDNPEYGTSPAGDGTVVHLRVLRGLVEDYLALAHRQTS